MDIGRRFSSDFSRLLAGLHTSFIRMNQSYNNDMYPEAEFAAGAQGVLHYVLELTADMDVGYLPGNELEAVYELQKHCIQVCGLLTRPTPNRDQIYEECQEAIRRYCYLLEMRSIRHAAVVEILCS